MGKDPQELELVPLPVVCGMAGMLSRSSVLRQVSAGTFPAPVRCGPNRVAWVRGEVQAHLAKLVAERDGASKAA